VAVDLAVMPADGGEAIADLSVLRDQGELFGSVASPATAWRVLDGIGEQALARLRAARAAAREVAWAQHADTRGDFPRAWGWIRRLGAAEHDDVQLRVFTRVDALGEPPDLAVFHRRRDRELRPA
jgi:hypothetical protein